MTQNFSSELTFSLRRNTKSLKYLCQMHLYFVDILIVIWVALLFVNANVLDVFMKLGGRFRNFNFSKTRQKCVIISTLYHIVVIGNNSLRCQQLILQVAIQHNCWTRAKHMYKNCKHCHSIQNTFFVKPGHIPEL